MRLRCDKKISPEIPCKRVTFCVSERVASAVVNQSARVPAKVVRACVCVCARVCVCVCVCIGLPKAPVVHHNHVPSMRIAVEQAGHKNLSELDR